MVVPCGQADRSPQGRPGRGRVRFCARSVECGLALDGSVKSFRPAAEDEPELLELDRAAELCRSAGIPWPAVGDAEGRQVGPATDYPGPSSRAHV